MPYVLVRLICMPYVYAVPLHTCVWRHEQGNVDHIERNPGRGVVWTRRLSLLHGKALGGAYI